MVNDAAKMLQGISATFWLPTPNVVTYSAQILVEDFRQRLAKLLPEQASEIHWTVELGEEAIAVDLEMLSRGLAEFFKNALQFREESRSVEARVGARDGKLVVELIEGKSSVPSDPETWGREPLVSTRRGGFGMGLFFARQVFDVHGGTILAAFEPVAERLTTRLSLPLAAA
jgi:nitrogen fixation/metabolism regulation signal transduction histidine kinase